MTKKLPQSPPLASGFAVYRRLLGYGVPYWKMFVSSVVAMVIYATLGPAFAKLIQPLIDGSFLQNDPEVLRRAPLILLGLSLVRGLSGFATDYCSGWVSRRVIADLRQALFDQLLNLPCHFYDGSSGGQLLSRLLYNTEQVSNSLTKGVTAVFKEGLTIIGLTALMFYENLMLSLVFMVTGPLLGISIRKVNQRFRKISMRIQESMGNVGHVAQEAIDGQRIVKVFNGKTCESRKFSRENQNNQLRQMKLISAEAVSDAIIQFIYIGGFATILYVV
ncbi:lipid ABC transporter permease/ATP-binding protein, partial [Candidatus Woesearchaeota archaeon]|nr:lipid ABC transporter permease/ATP-binding protein [Candidatus Woesearchaeota archaeon]